MLSKAIKGAVKVAKPHAIAAGKDLVAAGTKRGVKALNKKLAQNQKERNGKVYKQQ